MQYKEYDIMARVHKSMSDLYSLNEDGSLAESQGILIDNDLDEIVWYEVSGMEHLDVMDIESRSHEILPFVEIPTIEEAKRRIDLYEEQSPIEDEDILRSME